MRYSNVGIPFGPFFNNLGHCPPGLHVIDDGGASPQAFFRRVWGPWYGLAHPTFQRSNQSGFFPADKSSGAPIDLDVKVKARAENVLPQQSQGPGLLDGDAQIADGQGVFQPHVDITLMSSQGISPDDHPLQDGVGIAFHESAVHESPRVPFVAIAHYINGPWVLAGIFHGKTPLASGRKAGAAPPP